MRRVSVSVVLSTALLTALAACSGPAEPVERAATTSAAGSTATEFHRLGYVLVPPSGWQSGEGSADWEDTGGAPRLDNPAFDSFVSPSSDPRILIGRRPVQDGAGLDPWIAQMRANQLITYPADTCNAAEDQQPASLGGEPAVMVAFHCPKDGPEAGIVQFLARHGEDGWVAQCFSGDGVSALTSLEERCTDWLASFRFAP